MSSDTNGNTTKIIDKAILCAPLKGYYHEADSHKVNQEIVSLTTRQTSKYWIKATLRYRDGRRSMKALMNQFSREGNTTRSIA